MVDGGAQNTDQIRSVDLLRQLGAIEAAAAELIAVLLAGPGTGPHDSGPTTSGGECLSDPELRETIRRTTNLTARLTAVTSLLVAQWHERRVWRRDGHRSATAGLGALTGLSHATARREVARARALRRMPATMRAALAGHLGSDGVDLLRRADSPCRHELFLESESEQVPDIDTATMESILFDGPTTVVGVSSQRTFTGVLRRAIAARDRFCTHPSGCDVPVSHCDVDHIIPWSRGGPTRQENGRLRCSALNRHPDITGPPDPPRVARDITAADIHQVRQRWRQRHGLAPPVADVG